MDTQPQNIPAPQAPPPLEPKKTIKTPVLLGLVGIAVIILSVEAYIFFKSKPDKIVTTAPIQRSSQPTGDAPQIDLGPKDIALEKVPAFIDYLENYKGNEELIYRAFMTVSLLGEVVKAEAVDEEINGVKNVYLLSLKNESGKSVDIYFTQGELDSAAVRLITEEGYASIKVTDIHTGERVALTERLDLLSDSPESKFSIEVNRQ